MDRTISTLNHPVFKRFQLLWAAVGAFQHVPVHQATRAKERSETGGYARWQRGLSEALKNNLSRKVIVCTVLEGEDEIGQTIERDGTHHHHVWDAVHFEFKGKRYQALDFFCGMVRPLGDDFDLWRREVGIRVHRHTLKRQDSADRDESGQH